MPTTRSSVCARVRQRRASSVERVRISVSGCHASAQLVANKGALLRRGLPWLARMSMAGP